MTRRYEITWYGRWLSIVSARDAYSAKLALISEDGYGYYTPETLEAREIADPGC